MDERNENLTPENLTPPEDKEIFAGSSDVSNVTGHEDVSIAGTSPRAVGKQGEELANKADEAVSKATGVVNKAAEEVHKKTHEVGDLVNESSVQVAQTLTNVSQCLRQTATDMTEHEHPVFGRYIRSAAETMERFSDNLRQKDLDFFVGRTEDLARHQPGIFLGSAFTVGFAIGRYLKGKSPEISRSIREKKDEVVQSAKATSGSQEPEDTSGAWY